MAELLIRPSVGDHTVLADLLTPNLFDGGRPVDRLVLNAQDAARRVALVEAAQKSGTPLLVDPLTVLLQEEIDPADPWVERVSFGRAEKLTPTELLSPFRLDQLVAEAVEFQVEHGATAIMPPYFYSDHPDSPAFAASILAIGRTARRMRAEGVSLPVFPLLCAQLQSFARRPGWEGAVDRFASAAVDVGPQSIGLCLSPVGDGNESYGKLLDVFVASRRLRSAGASVIAWRQGAYGPALVAAGLDGYECGMGIGERADIRASMNSRKPRPGGGTPFTPQGIYIPALRRSIPPGVARALFADQRLKGRLLCDSARCCPRGSESMLASRGRSHAVRARSRHLQELSAIPNHNWRLHHIAKEAASAFVLATKVNEVLDGGDLPNRVPLEGYVSLEQVAELLRLTGPEEVRGRV
jgi:hypothetical protein